MKGTSASGCTAITIESPSNWTGPLTRISTFLTSFALKNCAKRITDELDHYMLLPTKNQVIHVDEEGASVRVRYREREWKFPRGDCVLLPIENTTAELLARFIGQRLLEEIRTQHHFEPEVLRVEVEESIGQFATYEWTAGS